jgi:tetraprenyl-beta-curcumene synthase
VARALAIYRRQVLPQVRRELAAWREIAAHASPANREDAVGSIDSKGLNVEATAVFATLAPRRTRATATRAMVALQVAIDYLDSVEEQGTEGDGLYLERLFAAYRESATALPRHGAVATALERAIARCGEGQSQTHAAEGGDREALEAWARAQAAPPVYRWWEVAAGASSSVAAHALIAAAADPRTDPTEAASIDAAYFPSIGALTVFLDDLIDRGEDAAAGAHSYLDYYRDSEEAANRLELVARLGRAAAARLRHPHRHAAILAGVVGFYLAAAEAETAYASPIRARLLAATGASVRPIVVLMRRRRGA